MAAGSNTTWREPTEHLMADNLRKCPATGVSVSLAYATYGSRSDEALLIIPGLNANMEMYPPELIEGLVKEGPFFVVVVENRDTGLSTKFDQFGSPSSIRFFLPTRICGIKPVYELHEMADDAAALMAHLGVAKFHVMGCSMGGMIAQLIAIRHKANVLSLASLVSTTGDPDLPGPPFRTLLGFLRTPKDHTEAARIDVKYNWLLDFGLSDDNRDRPGNKDLMKRMAERMVRRSSYDQGQLRQGAAILRAPSREVDLRTLTLPSVVVHGNRDVVVLPAHGKRTAECLPNCKFVFVDGMAHVPDLTEMAIICREVADLARRARTVSTGK